MKNLPDGREIENPTNYLFSQNWGTVGAVAGQTYFTRTNSLSATYQQGLYLVPKTGTFTFYLSWSLFGTPLLVRSVQIELFRLHAGVFATTGLLAVIPPNVNSTGQVSSVLSVDLNDGLAVGILQLGGSEGQSSWNLVCHVGARP